MSRAPRTRPQLHLPRGRAGSPPGLGGLCPRRSRSSILGSPQAAAHPQVGPGCASGAAAGCPDGARGRRGHALCVPFARTLCRAVTEIRAHRGAPVSTQTRVHVCGAQSDKVRARPVRAPPPPPAHQAAVKSGSPGRGEGAAGAQRGRVCERPGGGRGSPGQGWRGTPGPRLSPRAGTHDVGKVLAPQGPGMCPPSSRVPCALRLRGSRGESRADGARAAPFQVEET